MSPIVQMNGIQDSDGEVFPWVVAGQYLSRITACKPDKTSDASKTPGAPCFKLTAKVCQGEENEGHAFNWTRLCPTEDMTEDDYKKRVNEWKRLFIAADVAGELESDQVDTDDLIGQELIIITSVKTWKGKKGNNVDDVLPASTNED